MFTCLGKVQVVMEEFNELMPATTNIDKAIRVTLEDVFSFDTFQASK